MADIFTQAEAVIVIACPHCSRANPAKALFCCHDGSPLGSVRGDDASRRRFIAPFVFPSGRATWTFDELVLACLDEWPAAVELLRMGAFMGFLRGVGRPDLAERAREAALFPDSDLALAQLLERLPTRQMPDAKLAVAETAIDLGKLRIGQDGARQLRLSNTGRGYLHGTIASDVPWLAVSRGRFGCIDDITLDVQIRGQGLRAAPAPQLGRLVVESSGGNAVVTFRADVPPATFAAGVLAGARTPRQLVEKAKANPQEAARLFESGAVARWYESNGWIYPVKGAQPGRSAIEQFFAALGLPAPRIEERAAAAVSVPSSEQPWFSAAAPQPQTAPLSDPTQNLDWLPITRDARPARGAPPQPLVKLTPVRHRSRHWLLALLPAALLTVGGLAGVGVALSLPSKPARPHPDDPVVNKPIPDPPSRPIVRDDKKPAAADPPLVAPPPAPREGPAAPVGPRPAPPLFTVPEFTAREVEVVFCLDTTGSMGGLLKGAQQKIWSICQQIAGGKPTPALKVGLVAYRDKGDDYITRVVPLSRDLDAVNQELLKLSAAGGGDTPESVNQALDEAVNRIKWSTDKRTLRIIFLVGDAPPHMDYSDDVKYPVTCKKAVELGILINTVQCGNDFECTRYWKDIAAKAEGEYVTIPQAGGVRVVASPFDARLQTLLGELMDTALIYGSAAQKHSGEQMVRFAKGMRGPAAADRAAFAAKSKKIGPSDLLDDLAAKRVKLEDVKADDLPEALKKLKTIEERRAHLAKVAAKRTQLQDEALELEKKRADHIKGAMPRGGGKDGFDEQVLAVLRKQAKKFEIEY